MYLNSSSSSFPLRSHRVCTFCQVILSPYLPRFLVLCSTGFELCALEQSVSWYHRRVQARTQQVSDAAHVSA